MARAIAAVADGEGKRVKVQEDRAAMRRRGIYESLGGESPARPGKEGT